MAKKTRVRSTIDALPEELKELVNKRLADVGYTYAEIAQELKDQGYEVSRSAVGRYALRMGAAMDRLRAANEQTKALMQVIKDNPQDDYSEAGLQILMDTLTSKIAIAQEDIDNMPVDKAGRLMVAIARTDAFRRKIKSDLNKQYRAALEEIKAELRAELQNNPEVLEMIARITDRVAEKIEELEDG